MKWGALENELQVLEWEGHWEVSQDATKVAQIVWTRMIAVAKREKETVKVTLGLQAQGVCCYTGQRRARQ
jgi:hypothetical protein